jgi:prepilin-type N-terminal cleavage/methylation domain-containing protein
MEYEQGRDHGKDIQKDARQHHQPQPARRNGKEEVMKKNRRQATGDRRQANATRRRGFTMIELLVVVSITAILATLTFAAWTNTADGDRVPSAARQLQSYLEGARDRAIHAKAPRGVRFLLDPDANDAGVPDTVSSMVFVGASGTFSEGTIQINDAMVPDIDITDADWNNLVNRGLFNRRGARIKIEDLYYNVAFIESLGEFRLTKPFLGTTLTQLPYVLDLEPAVLPNQEPRPVARGVVIDLLHSFPNGPPSDWGTTDAWTDRMDIMFSPRGTVIGSAATSGLLHFVLADLDDVNAGRAPGATDKVGDERIVTLAPHTGNISTHPVVPSDPYDADTAFKMARSGAVAK